MPLHGVLQAHPYRAHRLTTAPATEPVTKAELRTFARTDSTTLPDTEADDLIEAARQWIEDQTSLALIDQTWTISLDNWPGYREPWWDGVRQGHLNELRGVPGFVTLPRYPLSSITSVTTYDEDSNSTAVTVADVFDVDTSQVPGRLSLQSGQTWPVATRPINAIVIVYVAGYGSAGSDVPMPIRQAVLRLAGHMFDHRGECDLATSYSQSGAANILRSYAVGRL